MSITIGQLLVWCTLGAIAGSLAAAAVTRQKAGYGVPANVLLGMAGALVGGFLFKVTGLLSSLDEIAISARDILSAVVGSLAVLGVLWWKNKRT